MAEYLSKTIGDVVLEMVNRTTFLPAIQREYVWSTSQIEKLFDSLMCDYPINTMLFWHIREEDKKSGLRMSSFVITIIVILITIMPI